MPRETKFTPYTLAKAGFMLEPDGFKRFAHLKNLINLLWGKSGDISWNPWLEDQLQSLCDPAAESKMGDTTIRVVAWTGPGAAGKTHSSGLFGMAWFAVSPWNSCVTLTSTSKQAMGGRIWPVITKLASSARDPDLGRPFDWHIVNSRKVLQFPKGNSKNTVECFAVEEGELLKSVDKIKGRHTERMLLIVDEANSTPDAIFNAIPNMMKGCKELVILIIGNALSFFDSHGRCCEPKDGWNSITIDDSRWPTKGVSEWRLPPGIACHYDGGKSPNVIAGKTIYPHIYSLENWEEAKKWGENSIHFWSQDRGFWPPEGTVNTIFSDPLINRCDGQGFLEFVSSRVTYAFLDPAFGGDRCCLQLADAGETTTGVTGLQLRLPIYIQPKVDNEAERDYQIARQVIEECKARGVQPRHFGCDATGIGRGVFAIISAEWSPEVLRVEWGGKASDLPSSSADSRPSYDLYDNRVTELWFIAREVLESGQLKGLYVDAIKQFCSREYTTRGKKYLLSTKAECKKKLGYSPDEGDSISGLIEVARRNGILAQGKVAALQATVWDEIVKESQKQLAIIDSPNPVGISNRGYDDFDIGINWKE